MAMAMAADAPRPRIMVLPFPAQGHILPLMELSHRLVDHGFEVDFVNTDFNHARILTALAAGGDTGAAVHAGIHLATFPDGMGPDGDRTDIVQLAQGLPAAMLGRLEELVRAQKTRWVVADVSMSWALDLAGTAGVRVALFSTFSAAIFVLRMRVPKMVEDGIIDESAVVKRNERIKLSPNTPAIDAADLHWVRFVNSNETRRFMINGIAKSNPTFALADTIVCNTFHAIESEALALPKAALAIGPLEAPTSNSASQLWPEDTACLAWLDAQAAGSVVYVAFGSFTVFDTARLQELADGLALTKRPFLWVVRPNFANGVDEGWLDQFRRRVGDKGLVVGWAPQQRVLSHPSVIDFINTEFNHDRIFKSMQNKGAIPEGLHMLSIPDGMDPDDDHTDIGKMVGGLSAAILSPLEEMIRSKKIKWVIADVSMSWALELTNTVGVCIALFSTYSASVIALRIKLPKLIEDGVIDESGPLVVPMSKPTGHFLSKDVTCLTWLDTQAPGSVIYVAFGSSTVFDATRFHELANGLVLSGWPFIWVVRPNFTKEIDEDWFNQFKQSVNGKGLIVTWAPQQRFCNQSYACNVWKTGLKLCSNEQGIVTREEIKEKVVQLLRDEDIKARAVMWKNMAYASIREGGSSHANLIRLVNLLREG
ncbi:unnamed protein product [Miscanthus lutarioriparius]|uniref:Uncharacterized protein n=1 Tax=Miscanthus lutarioriparius TaxID=422564 RepID=A0A811MZH1_9POAL|nr:unnamed protein product [Miscanthus lutarioriparius]